MASRVLLIFLLIHQFLEFHCIDYNDPNLWKNEFPECGGNRQSPININLTDDKMFIPRSLKLKGYDVLPTAMKLTNDGYGVTFETKWPAGEVPNVSGGPLSAPYLFHSLHFHWGQSNSNGSEHTFNDKRYALEAHFVHYKSTYGTLENATTKSDGLVVIGIIYQFNACRGSFLEPVVKNLHRVKNADTSVRIQPFPLSIFQFNREKHFITYQGSLTTPPCSEIVTWLLSENLRRATEKQITSFRQLVLKGGYKENFRPVQPLNGRFYYYVRI